MLLLLLSWLFVKLLISVKNQHPLCQVVLIHGRLQSRHKLIKRSEGPVVGDHSLLIQIVQE